MEKGSSSAPNSKCIWGGLLELDLTQFLLRKMCKDSNFSFLNLVSLNEIKLNSHWRLELSSWPWLQTIVHPDLWWRQNGSFGRCRWRLTAENRARHFPTPAQLYDECWLKGNALQVNWDELGSQDLLGIYLASNIWKRPSESWVL